MNKLVLWSICACLVIGCGKKASPQGSSIPSVQVVVIEARRQLVSEALSIQGDIAANEKVEIKPEIEGIVQEIFFKEGQRVEKGELLLRLDETKLAASLAEGEANFKLSRATFERSKQLFEDQLISQQEFDQASSTFAFNQATLEFKRRELKDARIYAPFEGVISARKISPGQVVTKDTTLTWLVDVDPVKVEINVPERFLSQLRIGQTIEIKVAAYPERTFKGEVFFIAPLVDETTRTVLLKASIANPQHELKPGMFANLDLTLKVRENALVIPEVALNQVMEDNQANLFTVDPSQTAQLRPVKLGIRMAGLVEILSGLREGEKVIVEGLQKVGPGTKVNFASPEAAAIYFSTGQ